MEFSFFVFVATQQPLFHSSGKAFNKILECICRKFCLFSQKSISEVKHCCWARRPGLQSKFQFVQTTGVPPYKTHQTMPSWTSLYAQGHGSCWNRKGHSPNCCQIKLCRMFAVAVVLLFTRTNNNQYLGKIIWID